MDVTFLLFNPHHFGKYLGKMSLLFDAQNSAILLCQEQSPGGKGQVFRMAHAGHVLTKHVYCVKEEGLGGDLTTVPTASFVQLIRW